jgi:hypothetical protein
VKIPSHLRPRHPIALIAGLGGVFSVIHLASAQLEQTTAPWLNWRAVAASADFTRLIAAGGSLPGYNTQLTFTPIYMSSDGGGSWTQTSSPTNLWAAVASSADGVKLVAAASYDTNLQPGLIYTSTNAGASWAPTGAPSNVWVAVACSADGTRLLAATAELGLGGPSPGQLFTSPDSGATWTQTVAPSNYWFSVASSADGAKLVAVALFANLQTVPQPGLIYTSTNAGATWMPTTAPSNYWYAIASSADGTKLAAAADGGVYTSTDSGAIWRLTRAPMGIWECLACSADGTMLVAVGAGEIWTSTNAGAAWTSHGSVGSFAEITSLAMAADGQRFLAGVGGVRFGGDGPLCTSPYTGPWRLTDAPAGYWSSISSSTDGRKLAACDFYDGIYTSADAGATWGPTTAPTLLWDSIASSADGAMLLAAVSGDSPWPGVFQNGSLYASTNSGATWEQTSAPPNWWTSVASSADGTKLVAASSDNGSSTGQIYVSADSMVSWKPTGAPTNGWDSVASSADGTKLVAMSGPQVYTSSDSGATWTPVNAGLCNCVPVAGVVSSADGAVLMAASDVISISSDFGVTWAQPNVQVSWWSAVACSGDGTKLAACSQAGVDSSGAFSPSVVYMSNDSGATWTNSDTPAQRRWSALTYSGNGSNLVLAGGSIFSLRSPPPPPPQPTPPRLETAQSGAGLSLSWLVPSSSFVLQQNSDLTTTNWTTVSVSQVLNLTNLHQEVTIAPTNGSGFYRLKQQSLGKVHR